MRKNFLIRNYEIPFGNDNDTVFIKSDVVDCIVSFDIDSEVKSTSSINYEKISFKLHPYAKMQIDECVIRCHVIFDELNSLSRQLNVADLVLDNYESFEDYIDTKFNRRSFTPGVYPYSGFYEAISKIAIKSIYQREKGNYDNPRESIIAALTNKNVISEIERLCVEFFKKVIDEKLNLPENEALKKEILSIYVKI